MVVWITRRAQLAGDDHVSCACRENREEEDKGILRVEKRGKNARQ